MSIFGWNGTKWAAYSLDLLIMPFTQPLKVFNCHFGAPVSTGNIVFTHRSVLTIFEPEFESLPLKLSKTLTLALLPI
jgi:hypothetical protein